MKPKKKEPKKPSPSKITNKEYKNIVSKKILHERIIPAGYRALIKNKQYICHGCFRAWSPHYHYVDPQRIGGGYSILVRKDYQDAHFFQKDDTIFSRILKKNQVSPMQTAKRSIRLFESAIFKKVQRSHLLQK